MEDNQRKSQLLEEQTTMMQHAEMQHQNILAEKNQRLIQEFQQHSEN